MATKQIRLLLLFLTCLSGPGLLFTPSKPVFAASKVISLPRKTITLAAGQTRQLKVKNTKKKITWKSIKSKLATISKKGKLVAKRKGYTTITARIGKKKFTCKVKVTARIKKKTTNATTSETATTQTVIQNTTEKEIPTENPDTKDNGWTPGWY